jgi:hypothetical protein
VTVAWSVLIPARRLDALAGGKTAPPTMGRTSEPQLASSPGGPSLVRFYGYGLLRLCVVLRIVRKRALRSATIDHPAASLGPWRRKSLPPHRDLFKNGKMKFFPKKIHPAGAPLDSVLWTCCADKDGLSGVIIGLAVTPSRQSRCSGSPQSGLPRSGREKTHGEPNGEAGPLHEDLRRPRKRHARRPSHVERVWSDVGGWNWTTQSSDDQNIRLTNVISTAPRAPRPPGLLFWEPAPPARKRRSGRYTLGKRTRELASGASEMGQNRTPALQKRSADLRLKARHTAPTSIGYR